VSEVTATRFVGIAQGPSLARGLRHALRFLVVGGADMAALGAAILLGYLAVGLFGLGSPVESMLMLSVVMALTVLVAATAFGLYDAAGLDPLERFRRRVLVSLWLPWPSLGIIPLVEPLALDAVLLVGLSSLIFLPLSMFLETGARRFLVARAAWGTDVVVIGSGEDLARVTRDLLAQPEIGLRPIGYFGEPPQQGADVSVPRLGAVTDVHTAAGVAEVAVVLASPALRGLDLSALSFSRIVLVPEAGDLPLVSVQARGLGQRAGFDFANPSRARTGQFAKRAVDLAIAIPAIIFTAPLVLFVALLIKVISPGPAFYTQPRVGWRGETVRILKLRSMHTDAAARLDELLRRDPEARREWETYVKLSRDPRILPVIGNFIRRTSIDELPQLWNVVRGDISLVGPRPFPEYHLAKFSPQFRALRCAVRPGLTGLWQVSDRSGADLHQQEAIDTFYIRNWSLWLDLFIVLRTVPAILAARGAR